VTATDGEHDPGAANRQGEDDLQLSILGVRTREGETAGEIGVELDTTRGTIGAQLRPCEGQSGCAIFVGGGAGGAGGPANSVYTRLSRELVVRGVSSLRVQWRDPGNFEECVMDALAACSFLRGIGAERAVLAGHSFGGAVAVRAGGLGTLISAVVGLASQRSGTQEVEALGKPLLLIHGAEDNVLLAAASEDIFQRAREPKRLVILEGGGHGLQECADEVYDLLLDFISEQAGEAAGQ